MSTIPKRRLRLLYTEPSRMPMSLQIVVYEGDLMSEVESGYDAEIREELLNRICEEIIPNKTTDQLKNIVDRRFYYYLVG